MNTSQQNNPSFFPIWRDYLTLCKPKVVLLMLITALVGMQLATYGTIPLHILIFGLLGIALAASSAAVLNHLADIKIDAKMLRTHQRPLPQSRVSPKNALIFSIILGASSLMILIFGVNLLTAILAFLSLIGYAGVYTLLLKKLTPQNIVIGGIAGATPPLLGWTAVTNHLDGNALLLVLIIFVWTPPHFWALAIHRYSDYAKANIPMLPVTHGIPFTAFCIFLYTILLSIITLLPYLSGMSGLIYLFGIIPLNITFIYYAVRLKWFAESRTAIQTFHFSNIYLCLLFALLLIDHAMKF